MSPRIKINVKYTVLFASFMFLQYAVLRMANRAGRGYLSDEAQEKVYLFIQIFAIAGFLSYALFCSLIKDLRTRKILQIALLCLCFTGSALMFFLPSGSALYLTLTALTVLFLGFTGGYVYLRMSEAEGAGAGSGLCMGLGCSVGLLLQYFFQLRFEIKIALGISMLAAFCALFSLIIRSRDEHGEKESSSGVCGKVSVKELICTILIACALLLFTGYYNSYIHHLQVASGYTTYNVYSAPRLLIIPALIVLGAIGDIKKGKFLPISALCVAVIALLNSALVGSDGTYTLNMCLYYVAISAAIAYYDLTFWRLARRTRRPALWASFGRVLDSICVFICLLFSLQSTSIIAVLSLNIAALVLVIIMMAINGDLSFTSEKAVPSSVEEMSGDQIFSQIGSRYSLTPSELRVFRELVLTEDKQAAIGDRLSVSLRTVQANITSIYKKTGVTTRGGLVKLYNDLTNANRSVR